MARAIVQLIGGAILMFLWWAKGKKKEDRFLWKNGDKAVAYGMAFTFIVTMLCTIIVAIMKANKWL